MTTVVQSVYGQTQASSPLTLVFTGNATAHNRIILAIGWASAGVTMPIPTDANGTYTTIINTGLNAINCALAIFEIADCTGGVKHSTTIKTSATPPDNNCYITAAMYEVSGLTTAAYDTTNNAGTVNPSPAQGPGSQATGSTGTLSQASEWVLVACEIDDNPGLSAEGFVVPTGFTVDPNIPSSFQDVSDYQGLAVGWMDVSATTALNPSFTYPFNAGRNMSSQIAGIATFKKAASGGGSAVTWLLTH